MVESEINMAIIRYTTPAMDTDGNFVVKAIPTPANLLDANAFAIQFSNMAHSVYKAVLKKDVDRAEKALEEYMNGSDTNERHNQSKLETIVADAKQLYEMYSLVVGDTIEIVTDTFLFSCLDVAGVPVFSLFSPVNSLFRDTTEKGKPVLDFTGADLRKALETAFDAMATDRTDYTDLKKYADAIARIYLKTVHGNGDDAMYKNITPHFNNAMARDIVTTIVGGYRWTKNGIERKKIKSVATEKMVRAVLSVALAYTFKFSSKVVNKKVDDRITIF